MKTRFWIACLAMGGICLVTNTVTPTRAKAGGLDAISTALRVNQLFASEIAAKQPGAGDSVASTDPTVALKAAQVGETAQPADDENFLRRVSLDLIGELPTPEEVTAYVLDTSADKRTRVVDRLLADPRYGDNWARYWRDVILYRRNDERAQVAAESGMRWLSEQFNRDVPWNEIARSLVTASGKIEQNGATILLASQWGQIPETAAETARILMGVQIQCAQCHDHKTDRWKRTQFHELAAFFPRIAIRRIPIEGQKRPEFELASKGEGLAKAAQTRAKKAAKGKPVNPKKDEKTRLEYYMPDLNDPTADGTLMRPVFFLTGQHVDLGASDEQRREALARWITADANPWFAKAIVNRLWGELIGQGFYEPIDDLGPDHQAAAPQTLDLLASEFVAQGYDLKWLFRTITATQVYSRQCRPRPQPGMDRVAAVCPQPLRSDQLFNAIYTALGIDETSTPGYQQAMKVPGLYAAQRGPRGQFAQVFGYDPSAPRDESGASIAQALFLMNSPPLARAIAMNGAADAPGGVLGPLLAKSTHDDEVIVELYLRCLAREPRDAELKSCRDYLGEVKNRREAFEDILWALLNSTEFLYRQ